MKTKILRIIARLTAIATIVSSVMTVSPVHAAAATSMKDTMSRLKVSATSVTHVVTMTLTGTNTGTLLLTYGGPFSAFAFTSGTCTGGTVADNGTATTVVNVTLTGCTAGTLTINFTGTNAASTGSKTVSLSGTASVTGQYAVTMVDDDQVSVTATVDPTITFDLDTATTDTESAAAYTVPFGTLTPGTVKSSGATINSIWTDLSTNAGGGAVITVLSLNGALKSTAVPTDTIPSATATMVGTTANYGLCIISHTATTGTLSSVAPFNGATCVADGLVNTVGAVTTSAQSILNSTGTTIQAGRGRISVNVNATNATVAHNDYSDTLTFIATGTF